MFLESVGDPSIQDALHAQRTGYEQLMTAIATGLGMPQPADAARAIMACADGLVLHRLTVDPLAPASPTLTRVVRGCLG